MNKISIREYLFILVIAVLAFSLASAMYLNQLTNQLLVDTLKSEKQDLERLVQLAPSNEWWWKNQLNFTNLQLGYMGKT